MRPYFSEFFGNPSSVLVEEGAEPRKAVDEARLKVSRLLNAESNEVIFTGSATEVKQSGDKGACPGEQEQREQDSFF